MKLPILGYEVRNPFIRAARAIPASPQEQLPNRTLDELPKTTRTVSIYTLSDPRDGRVRYVGKAINVESRLNAHCKDEGKVRKARWIQSLAKLGLKPTIEVVEEISECGWQECEMFWIEQFKHWGFDLTNMTKGGEDGPGCAKGYKQKPEHSRRISESSKGRKKTPEHCANLSAALKGKKRAKWTDSYRASFFKRLETFKKDPRYISNLSEMIAIGAAPDARAKSVSTRRSSGKPWHSEGAKLKMSAAAKLVSHESRERQSLKLRGRKASAEQKKTLLQFAHLAHTPEAREKARQTLLKTYERKRREKCLA